MSAFQRIDPWEIRRRLKVDEIAAQQGRENKPPDSDKGLDACQQEIVVVFDIELDRGKGIAVQEIQSVFNLLDELAVQVDSRPFLKECASIPGEVRAKTARIEAEDRGQLERLRLTERTLLRDKNYFRFKHGLNREPEYPESIIWHWSIIGLMILLESLANAYFFAEGSSLGLLGGWIISIVSSLLVILGSAKLVGTGVVPQLNRLDSKYKVMGVFLLVVYATLLVAFCLLIAHYRALLTIDPENALAKTLPHLIKSPLDLDPISWIFFGASMLFGISAVIAGYTSDDRYPGYGALDRRYRKAETAYADAKSRFVFRTNKAFDEALAEVSRIVSEARMLMQQHATTMPKGSTLYSDYQTFASNVEQACNLVLQAYRDGNKAVRTSKVPAYFNEGFFFGSRTDLGIRRLSELDGLAKSYEDKLGKLMGKAGEVRETIHMLGEKQSRRLKEFIDEVETEAKRRLEENSPQLDQLQ